MRLTHARLMLWSMSAMWVVARTSGLGEGEEVSAQAQRSSRVAGIGFVGFELGS